MNLISLLLVCSILLCGCVRKSELDQARADLTEAQRKIEVLGNERVPRMQYDATRTNLRLADKQIAALKQELKVAQEQLAAQELAKISVAQAKFNEPVMAGPDSPTVLGLVKGGYERANETYVYSPDAQLNVGRHLRISSPTGLMVSDPEQKIVGGDLNIKADSVMLESSDGLLTTAADGSVKFIGKTLTMKFDDNKPESENPVATPAPPNASASTVLPSTPTQPSAP